MGKYDYTALRSHLWEAANILRGPVDADDFKTYIFPLPFFKRVSDVYDEEVEEALSSSGGDSPFAQFPENHRFRIPGGWQATLAGERQVKQALRASLLKFKLHKDQDLFDRAYGYVKQYY